VEALDALGRTALMHAAEKGHTPAVLWLLQVGAVRPRVHTGDEGGGDLPGHSSSGLVDRRLPRRPLTPTIRLTEGNGWAGCFVQQANAAAPFAGVIQDREKAN
jgi:hypothetical protein